MKFHSRQYQFKAPIAIYSDFEAILQEEEIETDSSIPEYSYMKGINCHVPSGFCTYKTCAYREVRDLLKLFRDKDSAEVFCKHIKSEVETLQYVS